MTAVTAQRLRLRFATFLDAGDVWFSTGDYARLSLLLSADHLSAFHDILEARRLRTGQPWYGQGPAAPPQSQRPAEELPLALRL